MFVCLKLGKSTKTTSYLLFVLISPSISGLRGSPGYFSSLGEYTTDFSIILSFLISDIFNYSDY